MVSATKDDATPDLAEIKRRIERLCSDPGHVFCDNWGHEDVLPLVAEIERLGNLLRRTEAERDECSEGAMETRAENERLRAALAGFVRCAEQRVWPMDSRVTEAKDLLGDANGA